MHHGFVSRTDRIYSAGWRARIVKYLDIEGAGSGAKERQVYCTATKQAIFFQRAVCREWARTSRQVTRSA